MVNPVRPNLGVVPARPAGPAAAPARNGPEFAELLRRRVETPGNLRLSAHARQRLESRRIDLTDADLARAGEAVSQAAAKGARETLLLLDRAALVVSVPNRTVITVLGRDEAAQTVFTQIDSAVVVPGGPAPESDNRSHGPDPLGGSPNAADRPTRRPSWEI